MISTISTWLEFLSYIYLVIGFASAIYIVCDIQWRGHRIWSNLVMTAQRDEYSSTIIYFEPYIYYCSHCGNRVRDQEQLFRLYHKLILMHQDHLSSLIIEAPIKWLTTGATLPIWNARTRSSISLSIFVNRSWKRKVFYPRFRSKCFDITIWVCNIIE